METEHAVADGGRGVFAVAAGNALSPAEHSVRARRGRQLIRFFFAIRNMRRQARRVKSASASAGLCSFVAAAHIGGSATPRHRTTTPASRRPDTGYASRNHRIGRGSRLL
jgi:hypothetical protein